MQTSSQALNCVFKLAIKTWLKGSGCRIYEHLAVKWHNTMSVIPLASPSHSMRIVEYTLAFRLHRDATATVWFIQFGLL